MVIVLAPLQLKGMVNREISPIDTFQDVYKVDEAIQGTENLMKARSFASEKGAVNWLSILPLAEHGFYQEAFRDTLALRYGPNLSRLLSCEVNLFHLFLLGLDHDGIKWIIPALLCNMRATRSGGTVRELAGIWDSETTEPGW